MNKKLMAVAVAGALSAPGLAAAQVGSAPGITFYGALEEAILNMKFSKDYQSTLPAPVRPTGELKKGELFSVGSRVGFRGREDLGGGSSAWFQIETGVTMNGRNDATNLGADVFGGRSSAIGLTNPWGDVFFGIWDSPYKRVTDQTYNLLSSGPFSSSGVLMGNGDTTGSMPNVLCGASSPAANTGTAPVVGTLPTTGVCFPEVTGNSTSFHRRNNDSINYTSPMMGGFQLAVQTELGNFQSPGGSTNGGTPSPSGTQHPKLWSLSGIWARGPLVLAAGYELHQGFRPGVTTTLQNINPKDHAIQGGIKWDFGIAQVGFGLEKISYGDNTAGSPVGVVSNKMDVTNWQLNGKLTLGPGNLWGQYTKSSAKNCSNPALVGGVQTAFTTVGGAACNSDAKEFAIGYDYILSKRTKVYLAYNKIDNGNGTTYYYAAASAPAETGTGTLNAVNAGVDVQVLAVGIQHTF